MDPLEELRRRFDAAVKLAEQKQAKAFDSVRHRFASRIRRLQVIERRSSPNSAAIFASLRKQFEQQLEVVAKAQTDARTVFSDSEKALAEMLRDLDKPFATGEADEEGAGAPSEGGGEEREARAPESGDDEPGEDGGPPPSKAPPPTKPRRRKRTGAKARSAIRSAAKKKKK